MVVNWTGIYPALTTPFTPDDKLNLNLFEKNLVAHVDAGIDGIILGGTLGESSVLSTGEKEKLVKFAVEKVAGNIPVILNIAEGSTREALLQVEYAKRWGAQGLMVLPPMRYKSDHRETVEWFKTIGNATDLPLIVYNNPVDYKTLITLDMLDEMQECMNIEAVKESTRDVTNVTRMRNRFDNRYKILCGVDTLAMEELCLGADGWVAGLVCAFPRETVAIYRLVKSGRLEEAIQIYRWFMPLLEMDIHPKLVQYIKLAEQEEGMGSEAVRAPRLILEGKEREEILKRIRDAIASRPELPDYLKIEI
ncbi:MAG TPA: dihydrodipicolinate synthase family protein [Hanamia sp.]|jgi:4-hydroxy-tetrahydrodipicolinate synthase|nr:dihydrodipicolinate synthase family protein [Hanamia sp.]